MILQISSGMGPVECRAAVGGIYKALRKEFSDIETITSVKGEVDGAHSYRHHSILHQRTPAASMRR